MVEFAYLGTPGIQALADAIKADDMSWLTVEHLRLALHDYDRLLEIRDLWRNGYYDALAGLAGEE